jgi:hypothetical protein
VGSILTKGVRPAEAVLATHTCILRRWRSQKRSALHASACVSVHEAASTELLQLGTHRVAVGGSAGHPAHLQADALKAGEGGRLVGGGGHRGTRRDATRQAGGREGEWAVRWGCDLCVCVWGGGWTGEHTCWQAHRARTQHTRDREG